MSRSLGNDPGLCSHMESQVMGNYVDPAGMHLCSGFVFQPIIVLLPCLRPGGGSRKHPHLWHYLNTGRGLSVCVLRPAVRASTERQDMWLSG
jgi:hypothetical protein